MKEIEMIVKTYQLVLDNLFACFFNVVTFVRHGSALMQFAVWHD